MKMCILIFAVYNSLQYIKFNDYDTCLKEGKKISDKLNTVIICVESTDDSNIAKIYPNLND